MKLFILKNIDGAEEFKPWYDKSFGHIVRAANETNARLLASKEAGDEGKKAWLSNKVTSCDVLSVEGDEKSIICDFRAA